MKDNFTSLFAATAGLRRDPTPNELLNGFPCGSADQKLFNMLAFLSSIMSAELNTVLDAASIAPDDTKTNQLLAAIQSLIAGAGGSGGSLLGMQVFSSSGTYTPRAGATRALVFATGAGAGGGGAYGGDSAGGGGAGATAIKFLSALAVLPVTIGLGGSAGVGTSSGSTANGTAGGTTSLGTVAVAGGGQPTLNAGSGHYGNVGGLGGTATAADVPIPGGTGATGTASAGYSTPSVGGSGGNSFWGGGGGGSLIGNFIVNPTGQAGQVPGSGGGGGSGGPANGGAGANGIVVILEFA